MDQSHHMHGLVPLQLWYGVLNYHSSLMISRWTLQALLQNQQHISQKSHLFTNSQTVCNSLPYLSAHVPHSLRNQNHVKI